MHKKKNAAEFAAAYGHSGGPTYLKKYYSRIAIKNTICSAIKISENKLKISFGTSGARGLVEQFTDEACCIFTTAFLQVMQDRHAVHGLAIAIDRRPSSPSIAAACAAAAQAMGIEVSHYGVAHGPHWRCRPCATGYQPS